MINTQVKKDNKFSELIIRITYLSCILYSFLNKHYDRILSSQYISIVKCLIL